jgi:hypothetical protein
LNKNFNSKGFAVEENDLADRALIWHRCRAILGMITGEKEMRYII